MLSDHQKSIFWHAGKKAENAAGRQLVTIERHVCRVILMMALKKRNVCSKLFQSEQSGGGWLLLQCDMTEFHREPTNGSIGN